MSSKNGLKLSELKVADLKVELDKRGLDKTGVKSVLVDRLRKALEEDDIDVEDYVFENASEGTPNKTQKRKADIANTEANDDEEEMETDDVSGSKRAVDEDYDTPCSDEENDAYSKHKDKSESARFRAESQPAATEEKDESENKNSESNNTVTTDQTEEKKSNETATPTTETENADGRGRKILRVIRKDNLQQVALTARTLWVTGLSSTTKVSDLKNVFSKHGKITSAKIVRSTKGSQRKWYGILTMATSKDVSKCIQKLHRTEIGGHVISVERRQSVPVVKKAESTIVKKKEDTVSKSETVGKKSDQTDAESEEKKASGSADEKDESRPSPESGGRGYEGRSHFRSRYGRTPFRRPFGGFRGRGMFRGRGRFNSFRRPFGRPHFERSSFRFSRGYRFEFGRGRGGHSPREYVREREMRMRRDDEMFRHKLIIRKQREEAYRLEREKTQLRIERELLEREKAEMLKMERVKQRLEREQLEEEREKLRRQVGHPLKRPYGRRGGGPPHGFFEKRKESSYEGGSGFHREKFAMPYRKPDYHDDFRREKPDGSESHPKFGERDERREVTYHERRMYSRPDFRGPNPGPSSGSPRYRSPKEDWKFHERRGEKPMYSPRGGHKRMGYYP